MKSKSLPSRWFDRSVAASCETLRTGAAKYRRHVDTADTAGAPGGSGSGSGSGSEAGGSGQHEKSHRDVHFAFLPERYEPLVDEDAQVQEREEREKKKKEKYKKVKKNVGKALRSTWKCLMLGLYNFALGYSTPITVAATFVPDFHQGRNRT